MEPTLNSLKSITDNLHAFKSKIRSDSYYINSNPNTSFEMRIQLIAILNESESCIKTIEDIVAILAQKSSSIYHMYNSNKLDYAYGFIRTTLNRLCELLDQLNDLKNKNKI